MVTISEKIEMYDLDGKKIGTGDRKKTYSKIKQGTPIKLKIVRLLLLNSKRKLYIQKRNKDKGENPGLLDKSVEGHVRADESYDVAVLRECAEELGFPASILPEKEFEKAVDSANLDVVGILKKLEFNPNYVSKRLDKKGSFFEQTFMVTVYLGYYDGPVHFRDGESSGVLLYTKEELAGEIERYPERFTEDLKEMFGSYKDNIK